MTPCQKLLKQEGTRQGSRIESMQQSSATPSLHLWFLGVAEDCCMLSILLAVPSCFNILLLITLDATLRNSFNNFPYTMCF